MTVKEVAGLLGVTPEAVKKHVRAMYPESIRNGLKTTLTEAQITEIKRKMIPTTQVVGAVTDLEAAEMLLKSAEHFRARFEQERQLRSGAEKKSARLQIRLSEAEQWYSVKRVLIETGREYPWKALKEYSTKHGYAIEKAFDKNYGEVNAYHRDVWNAVYGVEL
jgi:predicted transcriptional regulator